MQKDSILLSRLEVATGGQRDLTSWDGEDDNVKLDYGDGHTLSYVYWKPFNCALKWLKLWAINYDSIKSFFNANWRGRSGIACPGGSWWEEQGESSSTELSRAGSNPVTSSGPSSPRCVRAQSLRGWFNASSVGSASH